MEFSILCLQKNDFFNTFIFHILPEGHILVIPFSILRLASDAYWRIEYVLLYQKAVLYIRINRSDAFDLSNGFDNESAERIRIRGKTVVKVE